MAKKLYELLATESELAGVFKNIITETGTNFLKKADRYTGYHTEVKYFDESAPREADTHVKVDDTVPSKLAYTAGHITAYLDAVLQKESANQKAMADVVIDGVVIATDVPATFLLGLETKLKKVRDEVYAKIPTLQPSIHWDVDTNEMEGVFKKRDSDEKFRTKKMMKNHVRAAATDKHPAQVDVYNEDEKIARIVTDTWCGMISSAEKSRLLNKVDALIRAVKTARQRANSVKVDDVKIGEKLFGFINS